MPLWEFNLPRGRKLRVGGRPLTVGIVNCTPDSFSDGGAYATSDDAIRAGLQMLEEGADWLDVGGESTRPGSSGVPAGVQIDRVLPVLRGLRKVVDAPLSVDTMSPTVAGAALDAGADIVNDVSACRDPGWRGLLLDRDAPIILMHMRGTPLDMQANPEYPQGVTRTVLAFFEERLGALEEWGVSRERVILDPGIGFGKRVKDNLELIRNIDRLHALGRPILIGASRKGFLEKAVAEKNGDGGFAGDDRDLYTLIINAIALSRGAHCLRVHNVRYTAALARLHAAVLGGCPSGASG